jgi:fatty acid desaturase
LVSGLEGEPRIGGRIVGAKGWKRVKGEEEASRAIRIVTVVGFMIVAGLVAWESVSGARATVWVVVVLFSIVQGIAMWRIARRE